MRLFALCFKFFISTLRYIFHTHNVLLLQYKIKMYHFCNSRVYVIKFYLSNLLSIILYGFLLYFLIKIIVKSVYSNFYAFFAKFYSPNKSTYYFTLPYVILIFVNYVNSFSFFIFVNYVNSFSFFIFVS